MPCNKCKKKKCNCYNNEDYILYESNCNKCKLSCNNCDNCDSCENDVQKYLVGTEDIYYNKDSCKESKLHLLSLLNGTLLNIILEKIDSYLNMNIGADFSGFSLYCLSEGIDILNLKQFVEAISFKFCHLKLRVDSLEEAHNAFVDDVITEINSQNYLNVSKDCIINIEQGDSLKTILEKIISYLCNLSNCNNNSNGGTINNIDIVDSSSIKKNNINSNLLQLSVKISLDLGNAIQLRNNGIYVPLVQGGSYQDLELNGNILRITYGNSIILPTNYQSLSFNETTKTLSISNGNSVLLSSLSNGNTVTSDGKVKVNVNDTTGYLIDKINGLNNNDINIVSQANVSGDKINLSGSINYSNLISHIANTLALLTQLVNAIKLLINCFKYKIINNDTVINTYSYTQCDGTNISNINLGIGSSVEICALSVSVSSLNVSISIIGNC